jgi:hypothetical protein
MSKDHSKVLDSCLRKQKKKKFDPQFDLEIDGHMIKQVVVDFGSQVNTLPREMWVQLGKPLLHPKMNFLKLSNQSFIEPIGMLKSIITSIIRISMRVYFEVIYLFKGIPSYHALVI